MNFFKKIFKTEESEKPTIDDNTSTKACIALLLETSMADEVLDESELMALKNTLQKDFQINEDKEISWVRIFTVECLPPPTGLRFS